LDLNQRKWVANQKGKGIRVVRKKKAKDLGKERGKKGKTPHRSGTMFSIKVGMLKITGQYKPEGERRLQKGGEKRRRSKKRG